MNSKVFMILRILLGLFILFFGVNKFAHFIAPGEGMSPDALSYFASLTVTKTITVVAIVEIIAGLALLTNKFGALMALILMSISFNAVLFHATLDPDNIAGSIILLVLNVAVLYGYKDKYKDLLS